MFGNKEYTGIAIQDDTIRVARVRLQGKNLKLVKLDRFTLVEPIKSDTQPEQIESVDEENAVYEESEDADAIFGLDEEDNTEEEEEEDINFEELESEAAEQEDEDLSLDMVDESEAVKTNEVLLYNILTDIDRDKVNLGLNIPAGTSIYQIIRDTDFNEVKKKDLIEDLEDKLETIYGSPKSEDNYSYEVREDGSLLLASVDDEPQSLQLVNRTRDFYNGKILVNSILPDEAILIGLARANYELSADEITAVIQFGKETCRVVFLKGEEIWLISPIINEGTQSKTILNTVFSKILFQLDTGEVPNLNRILLANNTIGFDAVSFFIDNFPDLDVENLSYNEKFVDSESIDAESTPSFTTAIGAAVAAAGSNSKHFPELNFLPKYVADRQKVFKLQWHGVIILLLIFLTPITLNYFYSKNAQQITSLTAELSRMDSRITELQPTVKAANELTENLATLKEKLTMLDTLSRGSREWSVKLGILNQGLRNIPSTWVTSLSQTSDGTFIQGYTLYRNRIPKVVNIFDSATLLSVTNDEKREKQIFNFSIAVKKFTDADSLYSPPTPMEVKNLIETKSGK